MPVLFLSFKFGQTPTNQSEGPEECLIDQDGRHSVLGPQQSRDFVSVLMM
jgi:hypothetical protein